MWKNAYPLLFRQSWSHHCSGSADRDGQGVGEWSWKMSAVRCGLWRCRSTRNHAITGNVYGKTPPIPRKYSRRNYSDRKWKTEVRRWSSTATTPRPGLLIERFEVAVWMYLLAIVVITVACGYDTCIPKPFIEYYNYSINWEIM